MTDIDASTSGSITTASVPAAGEIVVETGASTDQPVVVAQGGDVVQPVVETRPVTETEFHEITAAESAPQGHEVDLIGERLNAFEEMIKSRFNSETEAFIEHLTVGLAQHLKTMDVSMIAFLREHVDPLKADLAEIRNRIALGAPEFVASTAPGAEISNTVGAETSGLETRVAKIEQSIRHFV